MYMNYMKYDIQLYNTITCKYLAIYKWIFSRPTWRTSLTFRLCKLLLARFGFSSWSWSLEWGRVIKKPFFINHAWHMTLPTQAGQGKSVLQLRVAGSSELLTITCPSMAEAENMADLVDGYCRLVNQSSTSIWSRKGRERKPLWFWQHSLVSS